MHIIVLSRGTYVLICSLPLFYCSAKEWCGSSSHLMCYCASAVILFL